MEKNKEFTVWSIDNRPQTIDDCILPKNLKSMFLGIVQSKNIPNMILYGSQGIGKTTVARALCKELNIEFLEINASKDGNIDTLRNTIQNFATTNSLSDSPYKVVILDEADYLNAQSTQPALRSFIESTSSNCRFIFTCNHVNKIIKPIHSRCTVIEFTIPKNERPGLAAEFFKSVQYLLSDNGIQYDKKCVAEIINQRFPDFRRTINDLQSYSRSNQKIDSGILSSIVTESKFRDVCEFLKEKKFTDMRKWVAVNVNTDVDRFIRLFYDSLYDILEKESIPAAVLILAECQYRMAFAADPEIQLVASFTQIMLNCKFQ